ncbi:MAG: STAS domain-containing protein [Phycisphaerales bacterium]
MIRIAPTAPSTPSTLDPSVASITRERGVIVLRPRDHGASGDAAAIRRNGELIYAMLRSETEPRVVLDLSDVTRLDAAWLSVIAALDRKLDAKGGVLRVAGVGDEHRKLIRMVGGRSLGPDRDSDRAVARLAKAG